VVDYAMLTPAALARALRRFLPVQRPIDETHVRHFCACT
jgi:hypothetical protein